MPPAPVVVSPFGHAKTKPESKDMFPMRVFEPVCARAALSAILCLSSYILSVGCSDGAGYIPRAAQAVTQSQADSLGQEIRKLRSQVTVLRLNAAPNYQSIQLDPTQKAYQRLDTASGFFLISCQDATPYLDGYKLLLDVGNPTSATYHGFTFNVTWGGAFETVSDTVAHSKDVSFTNQLKPASWNRVELILTPASAEEMKSIFLSMETSQLSLYR